MRFSCIASNASCSWKIEKNKPQEDSFTTIIKGTNLRAWSWADSGGWRCRCRWAACPGSSGACNWRRTARSRYRARRSLPGSNAIELHSNAGETPWEPFLSLRTPDDVNEISHCTACNHAIATKASFSPNNLHPVPCSQKWLLKMLKKQNKRFRTKQTKVQAEKSAECTLSATYECHCPCCDNPHNRTMKSADPTPNCAGQRWTIELVTAVLLFVRKQTVCTAQPMCEIVM